MLKKNLHNLYRIMRDSFKGYGMDQLFLHAASLTFYTLLSLVPILAVAFGFAKGFGFEQTLEKELYTRFEEQKTILDHALEFTKSLLIEVESGVIAGYGAFFLIVFVLFLFWTIENSMNVIWKVKQSRPVIRMITDYLAMMIICPFFFVISSSLIVYLNTFVLQAIEGHSFLQQMTPFFFVIYRFVTLLLIWGLFFCIYLVMPNTRVRARYALFAAVVAGTFYYGIQAGILNFQIGVSQYNAVYGSFAALPLFLLWLQVSWTLVLIGGEIAYHSEHLSPTFAVSEQRRTVTEKEFGLLVLSSFINRFLSREGPATAESLAREFGVSLGCITKVINKLLISGAIAEIKSDNNGLGYQLAQPTASFSIASTLEILDNSAHRTFLVNDSKTTKEINLALNKFERSASDLDNNLILKDIVS